MPPLVIFAVVIILLSVLPIMMRARIIPFRYRFMTGACVSCAIIIIAVAQGYSAKELGMTFDSRTVPIYALLTFAGVLIIILASIHLRKTPWKPPISYVLIALLLSVAQEFVYRAYLFRIMQDVSPGIWAFTLVSTSAFALLHVIYDDWHMVVALTYAGGIFLALVYAVAPNLILVSIAHFIFNYTATRRGFFMHPDKPRQPGIVAPGTAC